MATLVIADDDATIRKIVRDRFKTAGHVVETAEGGATALAAVDRLDPDLLLLDLQMPDLDGFGVIAALAKQGRLPRTAWSPSAAAEGSLIVIVITAHGTVDAAVRAMRAGAYDFVQKPFEAAHLEHVVANALETGRLRRDVGLLRGEVDARHRLVLGGSAKMREAFALAERAAGSDATILLGGESGTGKEVLARAIHAASKRASGPFVAVNCATLGAELLESELYGHEKGAFTGAVRAKPGKVELAVGGTLFLDEIGELPPPLQAKLLRVWPGNVRELGNVLERCIVLGAGDRITRDDLPDELLESDPAPPGGEGARAGYHEAVADAKRAILRDALRAEGGHQTRAARRLGLTQPYLARLLKNLRVK